ncbi:MAG: hypothetical protein KF760_28545 [Candidatus Eremiobacteraeota bacterium]|nr:hypothetical protein [Candidatus Eremiobacteraeota bacterium]MCW5865846.1 hypothetical protein [Candidatus Eremiobacteraeota bacterium]
MDWRTVPVHSNTPVVERLESARNYWLVTASLEGLPHCAPVWAVWCEGVLCLGTAESNPRCSFHLESGDEVFIVAGRLARADVLYRKKYSVGMSEAPGELRHFELRPQRMLAWNEGDFPSSATAWTYEGKGALGGRP